MATKCRIYNITFQQSGDDIEQLLNDLNVECLDDLSEKQLIDYLMQWDNGDDYESSIYDYDQIDTEFLGYRTDRRRTKSGYLLSCNTSLDYVGLSRFERIQ